MVAAAQARPKSARDGAWQVDPGFGVYVHIPFCRHRCHYCDFNTYEGLENERAPYVDAVIAEIRNWPDPRPATSIFFGGGTPTLLDAASLGRIVDAISDRFGIAAGAEITVEANPETVDERVARDLRRAGFGRISLGIQSAVAPVLAGLGRTHSAATALAALHAVSNGGFEDVNADLIYGSPWESDDDWVTSLQAVIAAAPDHVSAYALTIEEGTPLHTLIATGREPDVDPDVQASRHTVACELLDGAGYERYEISNWSKPGRASRHNVLYWSAGDYVGFGAGAHSHVAGHRWWSVRLPRDYIAAASAGRSTMAGEERLDPDHRAGEALMLGLRLADGIEVDGFGRRFGGRALDDRADTLASLESRGLIERESGRLRLSAGGTLLANEALYPLI